jgi:4-oxalocrotonate tautomerase
MPLVQVYLVPGESEHQKQELIREVTRAIHESIDAPPETVRVWITELGPGDPDSSTPSPPDRLIA